MYYWGLIHKTKEMNSKSIILLSVIVVLVVAGLFYAVPQYKVYVSRLYGKAEMVRAEQNRQIIVEEAKARLEAEKLNAQSEIERAKGMKQAMDIENGSLTPVYNQYLFIRTLEKLADKGNLPQIIYVPSEGLTPVMDVHSKAQIK